jgi:uncharacterized protein
MPVWTLSYEGVAIEGRIEKMVLSMTYTSHAGGAASDLEFELEDRDRRWQGSWFPQRGDVVTGSIGYAGEQLISIGSFQVDEVELRVPPDRVHMRCLSAGITDAMRTPHSVSYEGQTLLGIAGQIAAKYGFTVVGAAVTPDVTFDYEAQSLETDVEFLHRIAEEHNYEFTIRGTTLVFYSRPALEQARSAALIKRPDVTSCEFKAKTRHIYKAANVSYQDPASKSLITRTVLGSSPTGDTLNLVVRCTNGMQALLKASAALHQHNMLQVTGRLSMPGTTAIAAGVNITISGFGAYDGKFYVESARHQIERSAGYTTELQIRSTGATQDLETSS